MEEGSDDDPVFTVEITDELDLHNFNPREVGSLVRDYIDECASRGFCQVRLIHGKGVGNLRRTVHSVLRKHPLVERFALADESAGGWGATLAVLRVGDPTAGNS